MPKKGDVGIDALAARLLGKKVLDDIQRVDVDVTTVSERDVTSQKLAESKLTPNINKALDKVDVSRGGLEIGLKCGYLDFNLRITGIALVIMVVSICSRFLGADGVTSLLRAIPH